MYFCRTIKFITINNIESFKIDISNDDIEIKEGEKFEVKTNDPDVKFYHENSKVKISYTGTFFQDASKEVFFPFNKLLFLIYSLNTLVIAVLNPTS